MMLYEKVNDYGGKTLNLVASICNIKELRSAPFAKGFAECLALIQKQNRDYTMLLMDDIGHNQLLAKEMQGYEAPLAPIIKTTAAYYMINGFAKEPVNSNRAFMLI
jgi:hypothetical protein